MKTIFVSSTFRDMNFERDAIQQITLPMLNMEAAKYGQSVDICDLRWGINTADLDEEEGIRKVLDVCLDEIDRCKPPMVVLLGECYGTIPGEEKIRDAVQKKNWTAEGLDDLELSVTALEIEYGALKGETERANTLFYFREIDGDTDGLFQEQDALRAKKLKQLKDRIVKLSGGRVKTYRTKWNGIELKGTHEFAEVLAADLTEKLTKQWEAENNMNYMQKILQTQWSYIERKNEMFRARKKQAEQYLNAVQEGELRMAIIGAKGSGKSTLFSHMALRLREMGWEVLPFISALIPETSTGLNILRHEVYYLEEELDLPHMEADANFEEGDSLGRVERFWKLTQMYEKTGKKLVIMVDAVDQLSADWTRLIQAYIPNVNQNVRFIMTATEEYALPESEVIGMQVRLPSLNQDEKQEVIKGILESVHRELSPRVVEELVAKADTESPLYLSLMIQRLLLMDRFDFSSIHKAEEGIDEIIAKQIEVIQNCPKSLEEMSLYLLDLAGERINGNLVHLATELIAVSRHGLRQQDLAKLLMDHWNALDFSLFMFYIKESFSVRENGCYDYAHSIMRQAIVKRSKEKVRQIHKVLATYLMGLASNDPLRQKELAYHCMQIEDYDRLKLYCSREAISYTKENSSGNRTKAELYNVAHMIKHEYRKDSAKWTDWFSTMPEKEEENIGFIRFLYDYMLNVFEMDKEKETCCWLLDLVSDLTDRSILLYPESTLGYEWVFLKLDIMKKYADELMKRRENEDMAKAEEIYTSCCAIIDELIEKVGGNFRQLILDSFYFVESIGDNYMRAAKGIVRRADSKRLLKKAQFYYEKSDAYVEWWKQITLGEEELVSEEYLYRRWLDLYDELSVPEMEGKVLDCCEKYVKVLESILRSEQNSDEKEIRLLEIDRVLEYCEKVGGEIAEALQEHCLQIKMYCFDEPVENQPEIIRKIKYAEKYANYIKEQTEKFDLATLFKTKEDLKSFRKSILEINQEVGEKIEVYSSICLEICNLLIDAIEEFETEWERANTFEEKKLLGQALMNLYEEYLEDENLDWASFYLSLAIGVAEYLMEQQPRKVGFDNYVSKIMQLIDLRISRQTSGITQDVIELYGQAYQEGGQEEKEFTNVLLTAAAFSVFEYGNDSVIPVCKYAINRIRALSTQSDKEAIDNLVDLGDLLETFYLSVNDENCDDEKSLKIELHYLDRLIEWQKIRLSAMPVGFEKREEEQTLKGYIKRAETLEIQISKYKL